MKGDNRFITTLREGSALKEDGVRQIVVDRQTGINYLMIKSGYGLGLTPLLDRDGRPIITEVKE